MAMIKCPECKKSISDSAVSCPSCGNPDIPKHLRSSDENKKVSIPLGIGIFFLPIVFSWFTLQDGYSTAARYLSLGWLGVMVFAVMNDPDLGSTSNISQSNVPVYPESQLTYAQVNSEVGCDSKYSDDKKEDLFQERFKDHWFTWRGLIVLAEADNASLNLDGVGIQDLQVDFSNKNAGYNLVKDSQITVKFLMKRAGGCFLPFLGDEAIIVE